MIKSTTLISDVKGEFEGGNSLSVDWDTLIRRAIENMLDNCRPETLMRKVPIYGGLTEGLSVYYCPDDVLVPSELATIAKDKNFKHVPSKSFYADKEENTYTIEYVNGVRFLVVNHDLKTDSLTINEMEEIGSITGGTPTLNSHNKLTGTNSIAFTFTDAGIEVGENIVALDITDYKNGTVIVPAYIPTADDIESLELRLKTNDTSYYKVTTLNTTTGDALIDGWNMLAFEIANAETVLTPVDTNINEWCLIGTTKTGKTATVLVDKMTIQKSNHYDFEYYSNAPYVDGVTGALWKSTISNSNGDKINVDRDVAGILHYELCLLVTQSSTFDNIDSQASRRFEGQLQRKYEAYWAIHPSAESPVTYNISPEIDRSQDIDYGNTNINIT